MNKNISFLVLFIGLTGIIGFTLMIWITPYGAGVSPDSTIYIGGAKSILAGKGFFINGFPITHFPPLYPLILAAVGTLNINLVQVARFLNAILFGVNIGLVSLVVYFTGGRNFLTATLAILFISLSVPILAIYVWAWSEPLFLTFTLTCVIFISMYVNRPTLSLLIATSLSLGCALVTRYIGIAFFPATLAIVFIGESGQKLTQRIRDTLTLLVLACAPLVLFYVRNMMIAGRVTDRNVIFHPLSVSYYVTRILVLASYFIAPISLPGLVEPAILLLLAVSFIVISLSLYKRHLRDINWRSMSVVIPMTCLLFSVSYLLFLYISISIFDASTPIDQRIFSPVFLLVTLTTFSAIWYASQILKKPKIWMCFLFFIIICISIKTPDVIVYATDARENGVGYTAKRWRNSLSIAFLRSLPENERIYSNGSDAISFLADKGIPYIPGKYYPMATIPVKYDPYTTVENPLFNEELGAMCKEIREKDTLLLYFNSINTKYIPTQEEIESTCQLHVLHIFEDSTVYGEK
jgi:hypothetical protein